jgi:hypothetical protein
MPSSNGNDRSLNSHHRSAKGSPQCAALDLPPRRIGLYSAGPLDRSVIPLPGSMDVLTIILSARKQELWIYYALMATIGSVIGGYVTYDLLAEEGRKRSNASFRPDLREGLQNIRVLGLWDYRHRCLATTDGANGSISLCRRRNAIFRGKIPSGADGRPDCPVFLPGVLGSPLWAASAHGYVATWTSGPHRRYRAACRGALSLSSGNTISARAPIPRPAAELQGFYS